MRKLLPSSNQLLAQETVTGGSSSLESPSSVRVSQTAGQSMVQAWVDLTSLNLLPEKDEGHSSFQLSTTIKYQGPTELDESRKQVGM